MAFRTGDHEILAGASPVDRALLAVGGEIAPAAHPTVQALLDLWTDLRAMLDRQGVVYEDRRTQKVFSCAYHKGRAIAERKAPNVFVSRQGELVALSTLGDLPAMRSLLQVLADALGESGAARQNLRVDPR